jgi:uncharacterized coiled-coil protein SlyX
MSFSNNGVYAYSFYIPRICTVYTEKDVRDIFEQSGIGMVQRVDFTPINPRPGFGVNLHNVVRSAFVHLTIIYSTEVASHIVSILETGEAYKFYTNNRNYLILLKNRAPVPATMMNIHQVVDNCRVLEENVAEKSNSTEKRFEEHSNRIAELEATVAKQIVDIDRLQDTIYQLLGKVFDQESESAEIFMYYNYMVYGKICKTRWLIDEEDDGTEEYNLEYNNQELSGRGLTMDDLSVSTHSSMPSLVSVSSYEEGEVEDRETASTHSSDLTWLIDSVVENVLDDRDDYEVPVIEDEDSSKGSLCSANSMSQRMRFTAELCDNN